MNDLQKVLVVDDGTRDGIDPLSAELAELGLSSVTTSFEAADQVLEMIAAPSAIFLKMPQEDESPSYKEFLALADRLRVRQGSSGAPVIVWDRAQLLHAGGVSALLQGELGPKALSSPAR